MRLLLEKDFNFLIQRAGILPQKPVPKRRVVFKLDRQSRCARCGQPFHMVQRQATQKYCSNLCGARARHVNGARKRRGEESRATIYRLKHQLAALRTKFRELQNRDYSKREVRALTDHYIRTRLKGRSGLALGDFPDELVELKRRHLKLKRAIKTGLPDDLSELKRSYLQLKKSIKSRKEVKTCTPAK